MYILFYFWFLMFISTYPLFMVYIFPTNIFNNILSTEATFYSIYFVQRYCFLSFIFFPPKLHFKAFIFST